jgi:1-pyrroline-5-carboxylate dehydrogenase
MNPATARSVAAVDLKSLPEYRPTPAADFTRPENKAAFEKALATVRLALGKDYPLVIAGERTKGEKTFESRNPARPSEVIGRFQAASREQAARAIESAHASVRDLEPRARRRARRLPGRGRTADARAPPRVQRMAGVRGGEELGRGRRRHREAIDFMEFYAREMLRYAEPQPVTQLPGERGALVYLPLGAGAVIPPWNFPLAILVGMASAAIVTGNTVAVKPSSDSPAIAWQFFALMEEIGLPPGCSSS